MKISVDLPDENGSTSKQNTEPEAKKEPAVKTDFSNGGSPFKKAGNYNKRLKLFLWGDSGVGKTTLALKFPKPVVIDLEGGSDLYGDSFDFDVLRTSSADEASESLDWLLVNKHGYKTLVIDPITVYWDALQRKWSSIFMKRNKNSKGFRFEFYDFQPRDWMTIKAEFKEFIRKLIAVDMNVIITARQKVAYAEAGFMQTVGETFDGEKSLPYLFDTIINMYRDDKGKFMARCLKDRSNHLPKEPFDSTYEKLSALLDEKSLTREAEPIINASNEQKAKMKEYFKILDLTDEQVERRLQSYDANSINDLSDKNANVIIEKLEKAMGK